MGSARNTDVQPQVAIIYTLPQTFSWKPGRLSLFSYSLKVSPLPSKINRLLCGKLTHTELSPHQSPKTRAVLQQTESPVLTAVWTGGNRADRQKSCRRNSHRVSQPKSL